MISRREFPHCARTARLPFVGGPSWWLAAILVLLAAAGCSRWNWRGPGFGDKSPNWAEKMRPPADEKQFSGLDSRAREIERNLGVR